MKDKIFMILPGIIEVNLTIQKVKDVGLFPTASAQDDVQKVAICRLVFRIIVLVFYHQQAEVEGILKIIIS